jgi:uncharacterized membrane protein
MKNRNFATWMAVVTVVALVAGQPEHRFAGTSSPCSRLSSAYSGRLGLTRFSEKANIGGDPFACGTAMQIVDAQRVDSRSTRRPAMLNTLSTAMSFALVL